jgi:hypothetical protein
LGFYLTYEDSMNKNARQFSLLPGLAILASSALGISMVGCSSGGDNSGGTGGNQGLGGAITSVKQDAGPDMQVISTGGASGIDAMGTGGTGGIKGIDAMAGGGTGGISATGGIDGGGGSPTPDAPSAETARPDVALSIDVSSDSIQVGADAPADGLVGPAPQCRAPKSAFGFGGVIVLDAVADQEGNLFTSGSFNFNVPFDFRGKQIASNGSMDMLVAKLDAKTGNAIWVLTAGDEKDQKTTDVAVTSAGIAVAGTFTGSLDIANGSGLVQPMNNPTTNFYQFLAGLKSSDGSALWAKSVNLGVGKSGNGVINHIASNYSKDYFLVCGSAINGASSLGATGTAGGDGYTDVLVAAVKIDGTVLWAKIFGGAQNQACVAAALDDSGNAVFTGSYSGTLDFGSGALPSTSNAWVAKFDGSTGALMAAKPLGTVASSALDAGVAAATKVNSMALATNAQGDVVVAGRILTAVTFGATTLTNTGIADALVVKLSGTDLSPTWARRWGADYEKGAAGSTGVAFDSFGNATVVGTFQKNIDVGGTQTGGVDGGMAGVIYAGGSGLYETVFVVNLNGNTGATLCANAYGGVGGIGNGQTVFIDRWAMGGNKDSVAVTGSYNTVIDFGVPNTALAASAGAYDGFLLEM